MDSKTLGRRIFYARKKKSMTGEEFAEHCNINATYLRQLEAGTKIPSLPMFVEICKKLEVSPNELLPEAVATHTLKGIDGMLQIIQNATPNEIAIITAMLQSVSDVLKSSK